MSADGEISVAVKAEGVDDAAAELGDGETMGGGGGGGGDGGGGGLSEALSGGIVGGLVSQLLGPLLDVLSPMLQLLNAFLAPVAAMLLRLLSPVLRFLIQLLPAWMQFINDLPQMLANLPGRIWSFITGLPRMIWDFVKQLPGQIWNAISSGAQWIANGAAAIGESVWNFFKDGIDWLTDLPGKIADALSDILDSDAAEGAREAAEQGTRGFGPILPPVGGLLEQMATGGIVTGPTPALVGEAGPEAVIPLDRLEEVMGDQRGETMVNIGGGLSPFVERIERDRNFEA